MGLLSGSVHCFHKEMTLKVPPGPDPSPRACIGLPAQTPEGNVTPHPPPTRGSALSTHLFGNSKFRDSELRWAGGDLGPGDQWTCDQGPPLLLRRWTLWDS